MGCKILIGNGQMEIFCENKIILTGQLVGNLYHLDDKFVDIIYNKKSVQFLLNTDHDIVEMDEVEEIVCRDHTKVLIAEPSSVDFSEKLNGDLLTGSSTEVLIPE